MSKFSRSITRSLKELHGGLSYIDRLSDWWDNCYLVKKWEDIYYPIKNFTQNLPVFIKMAWNWRSWDSHYTIEAFCVLLEEQAKALQKYDRHVGSLRCARRCFTAAGLLRTAYNRPVDKTLVYLMHRNPMFFVKIKDSSLSEMRRKQITDKRVYDGMYEVARKRSDKAEATAKKEAWEYIHKYIEHFWS